jgi:hypothetical protein
MISCVESILVYDEEVFLFAIKQSKVFRSEYTLNLNFSLYLLWLLIDVVTSVHDRVIEKYMLNAFHGGKQSKLR